MSGHLKRNNAGHLTFTSTGHLAKCEVPAPCVCPEGLDGCYHVAFRLHFKIWNKTDYTVINSGSVSDNCTGSICEETISTGKWGTVILEVTSINSTTFGGSYKILSPLGAPNFTINTDKSVYRPGETVNVNVYTVGITNSLNMSIIDSNGGTLLSNSNMTKNSTNETHWYSSYTLGDAANNGTYVIRASADGGTPSTGNKTFDVLAWRIAATLDRTVYNAGKNVTINVSTSEVHTSLNFTIKIDISDPDDDVVHVTTNGKIVNNDTYSTTYQLPENATGGQYDVLIFINDTKGRTYNTTKKFTIGNTSMLSVTPSSWSVSTEKGGYFNQTFKVKNIGEDTLYNFTIYTGGDLSDYIDTTEKNISDLQSGESSSFIAYMTLNQVGNRTGSIVIENSITKYVVNVTGYLSSPAVVENKIFVAPTMLTVVTIPNKISQHNFTLTTTNTQGASSIVTSVLGNVLGMASVKSVPSNITSSAPGAMVVEMTTYAKEVGSYSGSINISSTAGSAQISPVTIEVIGDLNILSNEKLAELNNFTANITALKSRGKNVSEIESLMNSTKSLLNESASAYNDADYATSKSKYDLALANIQSIGAKINDLQTQVEPPVDYSGIIWTVAIIIVLAIVGIFGYKNKDKIQQMLQQKGKKAEAPKYEEERKEYKKPPYGQGEYRTEYY